MTARLAQRDRRSRPRKGEGGTDDTGPREAELFDRLLASAAGLPRVCCLKKCRRAKRCLGPDLVCLRHHRGLARARFKGALKKLGWPNRSGVAAEREPALAKV